MTDKDCSANTEADVNTSIELVMPPPPPYLGPQVGPPPPPLGSEEELMEDLVLPPSVMSEHYTSLVLQATVSMVTLFLQVRGDTLEFYSYGG